MAVCEIWDVRGRLDHPIDYAENPEKTANPKYTEADLRAHGCKGFTQETIDEVLENIPEEYLAIE